VDVFRFVGTVRRRRMVMCIFIYIDLFYAILDVHVDGVHQIF